MLLFASLLLCTYHKNLACLFFATINKRIYNQEITTLPKRFSFHLHYLICFIYIYALINFYMGIKAKWNPSWMWTKVWNEMRVSKWRHHLWVNCPFKLTINGCTVNPSNQVTVFDVAVTKSSWLIKPITIKASTQTKSHRLLLGPLAWDRAGARD